MNQKNTLLTKIEKLFEPDIIFDQFSFLQESPDFQIEDNFSLIENISYYKAADTFLNPDWCIYFSRLIPFFEFGLLIRQNELSLSFYKGLCHDCAEFKLKINLPQSQFYQILKTDSPSFLKKIKLNHLVQENNWSCYLVRVSQDSFIVLFSEKAEPWNQLMMEALQKSMINFSL